MFVSSKSRELFCAALLFASVFAAPHSRADSFVIDLTREFSGSASLPSGPTPWGRATFTDIGTNRVQLTITRSATLAAGEFFRTALFNLDPALRPRDLNITRVSGPVATISTRSDSQATSSAYRGDGGSYFDFKFEWPTSSSNINRFDNTWTNAVFNLTMPGLNAMSFRDRGVGAGNSPNGLYTAFHVQGIPGGGSSWITGEALVVVPLPTGVWMGLAGLGCIALHRRMKRHG